MLTSQLLTEILAQIQAAPNPGPLEESVNSSAFHAEDCGFEPRRDRLRGKHVEDKKNPWLKHVVSDKSELIGMLSDDMESISHSVYEQMVQFEKYRLTPTILLVSPIGYCFLRQLKEDMNASAPFEISEFMGLRIIVVNTVGDWLVEVR